MSNRFLVTIPAIVLAAGEGPFNDLVSQIEAVTQQPVRHVFVTHVHQNHSGNIGRFIKAGADVNTCEGLKRNLETGGVDGKGYSAAAGKPDAPNLTFARDRQVNLGNATVKACHFANAQTALGAIAQLAGATFAR